MRIGKLAEILSSRMDKFQYQYIVAFELRVYSWTRVPFQHKIFDMDLFVNGI